MILELIVYGKAIGKKSPKVAQRGKFIQLYTDTKTRTYEQDIKNEYIEKYGDHMLFAPKTPLVVTITEIRAITLSASKKRAKQALDGQIAPITKPDTDNISKSVLDALKSLAFDDDSRVVEEHIYKKFGEIECTKIYIREWTKDE